MKILVTAFQPFGGEKINPAFEAVKRIKDNIKGVEVIKLEIPVVFNESVKKIIEKAEVVKPDFILSIGQAGGRTDITIERVAINLDDARIADNIGQQPIDMPIDPKGQDAYFSTLPIKAMVNNIREKGVPASISNTAGTYVCNHVMYGVLNYAAKNGLNIKGGFMHIPFLFEQVVSKPNVGAMDLNSMVIAIEAAIEAIATTDQDIKVTGGTIC